MCVWQEVRVHRFVPAATVVVGGGSGIQVPPTQTRRSTGIIIQDTTTIQIITVAELPTARIMAGLTVADMAGP